MNVSPAIVNVSVLNGVVASIIVRVTYSDRLIKQIHLTEKENVAHHSPLVLILVIRELPHEVGTDKSTSCKDSTEELARLVTVHSSLRKGQGGSILSNPAKI